MSTASVSRRAILALGILLSTLVATSPVVTPAGAAEKPVTVFAAASLKDVVTSLSKSWTKTSGKQATL